MAEGGASGLSQGLFGPCHGSMDWRLNKTISTSPGPSRDGGAGELRGNPRHCSQASLLPQTPLSSSRGSLRLAGAEGEMETRISHAFPSLGRDSGSVQAACRSTEVEKVWTRSLPIRH
ncbi:hypothetical protein AAFF_G00133520 [Aldrovandia affinis]|uniref:Uncharacterized protein n=1 Tax=Aldrovandia affinis TaxID=143900 RepID=A0AAD7RSZ6_9TELE|nr:hypothetical protein AAFF_G00133520 [Aldrovandia affinis]